MIAAASAANSIMNKPLDLRKFRIHAVTDTVLVESADFLDRARLVSATGLAAINLRAHGLEGRRIYGLAEALRGITAQEGVPLVVNDRLDVALAVAADAVHLGRRSIPLQAAAELCRVKKLPFGYSCHSLEEARLAQESGAGYVYLGTIFSSASKPGTAPAGLKLLERVCPEIELPVFAIGGISPANAAKVAGKGAYGAAAISAVWSAGDIAQALERMNACFESQTAGNPGN